MSTNLPIISLDEVSEHSSRNDGWMVIYDRVYDVTNFLREHPGGEEVIQRDFFQVITISKHVLKSECNKFELRNNMVKTDFLPEALWVLSLVIVGFLFFFFVIFLEKVMAEYLGYDATFAFRGVGHSEDAVEMLEEFLIGILPAHERLQISP